MLAGYIIACMFLIIGVMATLYGWRRAKNEAYDADGWFYSGVGVFTIGLFILLHQVVLS